MEFIIIAIIAIILSILLGYLFDYNKNKIKHIADDKELDELASKYPSNIEICKKYLKKLENQNVKIDNGELLIKLIYFVQRMIQTKGLEKVTKKSGIIKISREFIKVFNEYKKTV